MAKTAKMTIDSSTGTGTSCYCGCGNLTRAGRVFLQGHDGRLKGELIRAYRGGASLLSNATVRQFETNDVEAIAARLNWSHFLTEGKVKKVRKAKATTAPTSSDPKVRKFRGLSLVKEVAPVPRETWATVGRWSYKGTILDGKFTYRDRRGNALTVTRFVEVAGG